MKTLFSPTGFHKADFFMGNPGALQHATLGRPLSAAEIDDYTSRITKARSKLAQVRAWIAARIDQDPMLEKTFSDPVVQKNFWDYMDLINHYQYDTDHAYDQLQNPVSADYDIPDGDLAAADSWVILVDDVYQGMSFGKPLPGAKPAVTVSPTTTPAARNPYSPTGGAAFPPITTPNAAAKAQAQAGTTSGLSSKDLLIGGGIALGVGALLYALS